MVGSIVAAVAVAGGSVVPAGAADAPQRLDVAAAGTALRPAQRLDPPTPPPPPPPPAPPPAPPHVAAAQEVLALVNAERRARGLVPMVLDGRLGSIAQSHSVDQATRGIMSHTGGDGSTLRVRMDRSGFPWRSAGENVAYGYTTAAAVMNGWMNSKGHRDNILGSFTHLGVGLASSPTGVPYWTQVFATPR